MADQSDFEVQARPSLRVVTPGAHVTYFLKPKKATSPSLDRLGYTWFAINDPKSVTLFRPATLTGPLGRPVWEDATWSFEGVHHIVCRVGDNGTFTDYVYEQEVASLQSVIAAGPQLPLDRDDPEAVLDGVARHLDVVAKIAEKSPPATEALRQQDRDERAQLVDYRDRLKARIEPSRGKRRIPVYAEHLDTETQTRTKLRLFLVEMSPGEWKLVDWTNPTVRMLTGEYAGKGADPRAAVKAAFEAWDSDNRYPDGAILYRVQKADAPELGDLQSYFETDGSSFWDSVSSFFAYIGLASAVVAGVVTFLAPVPGSQLVSAAIWTSIFSSTASATINIGDRAREGFSSFRANAFDVLTIAANLFGATGMLWSRGALLSIQSGRGVMKVALLGQVTADSVQGVLLSAESIDQIQKIVDDPGITPKQKTDRILTLLGQMAVAGTMLYINVKGTKVDLDNLAAQARFSKEMTPQQRLKQLGDPHAEIDLTKPPTAEGHTKEGPHTTKVQVDQEAATPHASGRTSRRDARTPEQRFKDAIGNHHYEAHKAEVPRIRAAHPEVASLTDNEIIAMIGYCGNNTKAEFGRLTDYQRINQALRAGDQEQLGILREFIDHLKNGLTKLPRSPGDVFRTMNGVDPADVRSQFIVGTPWQDRAFMSTAHTKPLDHAQLLLILNETKSGANIEAFSQFPEREVLFAPGAASFEVLRVIEYAPGRFVIYLREL